MRTHESVHRQSRKLALLKRIVRVNEKDIVIDLLTIFNRLVFASEREYTLEDSLRFITMSR